jgi:hypothetical protein
MAYASGTIAEPHTALAERFLLGLEDEGAAHGSGTSVEKAALPDKTGFAQTGAGPYPFEIEA